MTTPEAEARARQELLERYRDAPEMQVQWLAGIIRRAAEEAEVRAFGDRKEMEAEVERLKRAESAMADAWTAEGSPADWSSDGLRLILRRLKGYEAKQPTLQKDIEGLTRDRAALVAAGDALSHGHDRVDWNERIARWIALAHPERP